MGIEWFRDLSIAILGFVTTAVLIFVAIIIYRLYRKITTTLFLVKTLMKSVNDTVNMVEEVIKTTSQNINDTVTEVKDSLKDSIKQVSKGTVDAIYNVQECTKPVLPILAIIQGICGGFQDISKMFKKESNEGGNSNE
jgi:predicted PurR-regulated permease PerM